MTNKVAVFVVLFFGRYALVDLKLIALLKLLWLSQIINELVSSMWNFVQRDKYSSVLIVGRPFNFSELNIKPGTCGEYQMGRGNVKLIRLANHPIRARAFIFAREKTLSNIVRIAVQVTLWLSATMYSQCRDFSFSLCQDYLTVSPSH